MSGVSIGLSFSSSWPCRPADIPPARAKMRFVRTAMPLPARNSVSGSRRPVVRPRIFRWAISFNVCVCNFLFRFMRVPPAPPACAARPARMRMRISTLLYHTRTLRLDPDKAACGMRGSARTAVNAPPAAKKSRPRRRPAPKPAAIHPAQTQLVAVDAYVRAGCALRSRPSVFAVSACSSRTRSGFSDSLMP